MRTVGCLVVFVLVAALAVGALLVVGARVSSVSAHTPFAGCEQPFGQKFPGTTSITVRQADPVDLTPVLVVLSLGIVVPVGAVLFVALLVFLLSRRSAPARQARASADTALLQEMLSGVQALGRRVEALETILADDSSVADRAERSDG